MGVSLLPGPEKKVHIISVNQACAEMCWLLIGELRGSTWLMLCLPQELVLFHWQLVIFDGVYKGELTL